MINLLNHVWNAACNPNISGFFSRSGVSLKKVEAEAPNRGENALALSGIAGMLQKALHERSAAICQSSSEDEEADDEDEWEEWAR